MKKELLWLSILALVSPARAVNADAVTPPDVLYASAFRSELLSSLQPKPWHLKAHYSVRKAGKMENGVFEEWWVDPHRYKLSYDRKGFAQTDYASDAGLFRMGEQQWPVGEEALIHQEIAQPLPAMPDANDAEIRVATYGGSEHLRCVEVAYKPVIADDAGPSDPVYCMDPGKPVLRVAALYGMHSVTTYNRIAQSQGHYIAEDIQKTWSNQTIFTLTVDSMEILPEIDAATIAPPAGATLLAKDKITLTNGAIIALKLFPLKYPSLAKQIHSDGRVDVHVTIDRLGHVVKVTGATGPALFRQPAIDSVSHWIFRPFLFCGEPVEVDAEVPIAFRSN